MTNDQWAEFEASLENAPEITRMMYAKPNPEIDQDEMLALAHALLSANSAFHSIAASGKAVSSEDFRDLTVLLDRLMAGMYGRLCGLARAYDRGVTQQVLLEAELASNGK